MTAEERWLSELTDDQLVDHLQGSSRCADGFQGRQVPSGMDLPAGEDVMTTDQRPSLLPPVIDRIRLRFGHAANVTLTENVAPAGSDALHFTAAAWGCRSDEDKHRALLDRLAAFAGECFDLYRVDCGDMPSHLCHILYRFRSRRPAVELVANSPRDEGRINFELGDGRAENPYDPTSRAGQDWRAGYREASSENVRRLLASLDDTRQEVA